MILMKHKGSNQRDSIHEKSQYGQERSNIKNAHPKEREGLLHNLPWMLEKVWDWPTMAKKGLEKPWLESQGKWGVCVEVYMKRELQAQHESLSEDPQ